MKIYGSVVYGQTNLFFIWPKVGQCWTKSIDKQYKPLALWTCTKNLHVTLVPSQAYSTRVVPTWKGSPDVWLCVTFIWLWSIGSAFHVTATRMANELEGIVTFTSCGQSLTCRSMSNRQQRIYQLMYVDIGPLDSVMLKLSYVDFSWWLYGLWLECSIFTFLRSS